MRNLMMIGLSLCLVGCAHMDDHVDKPFVPPEYGMTRLQLLSLNGRPTSTEIYKKYNDTHVEFDMYVRKYRSSEEKVPVCLMDNKVVGWGKSYYEDHISPDDVRLK